MDIAYHSIESPGLELFGFYWFSQDFLLRRMPLRPRPFRPEIEILAWNTAGGRLRFRTNSPKIVLRGCRFGHGVMDHMPATGSHGFDLYLGAPGQERFINAASTAQATGNSFEIIFDELSQHGRIQNVTIFFPLYEGIKRLEIGLEHGAILDAPLPFAEDKRPIVVYGTSITQGGCASRPGLCWTNQLSMLLHRNIYNFGFSGNGLGEPEVARALAEIPAPALYILDYEANICGKLPETLPTFLDILRESHAETPVLILNSYHFSPVHQQSHIPTNRKFILEEIARRQKKGDSRIWFLDGDKTMMPEGTDGTVDGAHATDLGFHRIATSLVHHINKLLNTKE